MDKRYKQILFVLSITLTFNSVVFAQPASNGVNEYQKVQELETNIENLDNQIEDVMKKIDDNKKDVSEKEKDM